MSLVIPAALCAIIAVASPLTCRFCKLDPDTSKECVAYTDFNTNNPNMSTDCVTNDRCFRYVDAGKNGSVYFGCTDTTAWTLLKILCHYKLYSRSKDKGFDSAGDADDAGTKSCFTCDTDKCMATRSSAGRLRCWLYLVMLMYMMK